LRIPSVSVNNEFTLNLSLYFCHLEMWRNHGNRMKNNMMTRKKACVYQEFVCSCATCSVRHVSV